MKVVLSVGGSVLTSPTGDDAIAAYADTVTSLTESGCTVGVVVGGGHIAREYIETGRALGANEIELDEIGIAVTRLNARLLIAALGDAVAPAPARTYEEARTHLGTWETCVMGGTSAAHTTDAVAAALAEYIDAELLVLATSVSGVYDADPEVDAAANHLPRLTPAELLDVVADLEMRAGSPAPVDLLGAKIVDRARLRTIVLDGSDPAEVVTAVLEGAHSGTDVVPPDTDRRPTLWPEA